MNQRNKNNKEKEKEAEKSASPDCQCESKNDTNCVCEEQCDCDGGEMADKMTLLEKENNDLKIKVAESNDKFLRLFAEFDNFRKRTAVEKSDILKNGSEKAIKSMLPIVDDFERAIKALKDTDQAVALEGVELIYNKFMATLQKDGLKAMDAIGQAFDTDLQEAITSMPVEDPEMKGKVVDVLEKGYMLNDKVIRFAKVIIGA